MKLLGVIAAAGVLAGAPPFVVATLNNPAPPPHFTLRDQNEKLVHLRAQRGKVVLLTFLYTHCPDLCPLTATNLNLAVGKLGAGASKAEILAVSVDPKGDTPKDVKRFVRERRLGPAFHYLTGTQAKLAPIWRSYRVSAVRRGGGDVDHTLYTLLIDRTGKGRVLFDSSATPSAVAHDARLLLG